MITETLSLMNLARRAMIAILLLALVAGLVRADVEDCMHTTGQASLTPMSWDNSCFLAVGAVLEMPPGTSSVALLNDVSGEVEGRLCSVSATVDSSCVVEEPGCCTAPSVGNVDASLDGLVTMSDLTILIDHLFISLQRLACPEEGNVDMSPDELVTMGDLTILIDHLFVSLNPLPPCP